MKYGISIGRRQPMHRLHVDCIREIVEAGMQPVIIVGSVNGYGDRFYNPLQNPLSFTQQQEQIKLALPFVEDPEIIPLADVGDLERWCAMVVGLLKDRLNNSVMHYRMKGEEATHEDIKPLSASEAVFARLGLKSWRTVNKHPEDDRVNSSELRTLSIDDPRLEHELAAPAYIHQLMQQARQQNPDAALLNEANIPVTMLDLTLMRVYQEAGLSTADLLKRYPAPLSWHGLKGIVAQELAIRLPAQS